MGESGIAAIAVAAIAIGSLAILLTTIFFPGRKAADVGPPQGAGSRFETLRNLGLRRDRDGDHVGSRGRVPLRFSGNVGAGELHPSIVIRRQGLASNLARAFSGTKGDTDGSDYEIGDGSFDAGVVLRGDEALLRAALGVEGRKRVLEALELGLRVEDGCVSFTGWIPDGNLERVIRAAWDAAEALSIASHEIPGRIAKQIREDPDPDVRLRCLRFAQDAGWADSLRETLRGALGDEDWRISIAAAEALGEDGRPTLIAFLEDESAPDSPRLLALEALARTSLMSVQRRLLRARIDDISQDVRIAAIRALGTSKDPEALPIFLARLAGAASWEKPALIEALGHFSDPSAARALRTVLAEKSSDFVVVIALGSCGEIEDVERLRAWAAGPDRTRADASTALAAITLIQKRHGGESGGLALSEAPAEAGALSVPDAEAGALSDAGPPRKPTKQST